MNLGFICLYRLRLVHASWVRVAGHCRGCRYVPDPRTSRPLHRWIRVLRNYCWFLCGLLSVKYWECVSWELFLLPPRFGSRWSQCLCARLPFSCWSSARRVHCCHCYPELGSDLGLNAEMSFRKYWPLVFWKYSESSILYFY
jgi:hypothetical protein